MHVTVADLQDNHCNGPGVRGQQEQAQPGVVLSKRRTTGSQWSWRYCAILWPTYWTITAMNLVSVVSKCRPSQVWSSKRRTGQTERRPWSQSLLNNYTAIQKNVPSVTLNLLDF